MQEEPETVLRSLEGQAGRRVPVREADHREHFPADLEHAVMSPLDGQRRGGQGEEELLEFGDFHHRVKLSISRAVVLRSVSQSPNFSGVITRVFWYQG
jgi:hypothetical protein